MFTSGLESMILVFLLGSILLCSRCADLVIPTGVSSATGCLLWRNILCTYNSVAVYSDSIVELMRPSGCICYIPLTAHDFNLSRNESWFTVGFWFWQSVCLQDLLLRGFDISWRKQCPEAIDAHLPFQQWHGMLVCLELSSPHDGTSQAVVDGMQHPTKRLSTGLQAGNSCAGT